MSNQNRICRRVYMPGPSIAHPADLVRDMWTDMFAGRSLAWRFAVRDIKAQYRQTLLGILWALILPLANTITWIFLDWTGVVTVGTTDLPYSIYVFTGTMLWSIFMEALNAPLTQANSARSMLTKIKFPYEALIMSGILQTLFNGGIKIALLLVTLISFGIYPDWRLILVPMAVMSLILAGITLGLLITPIGLLYADIGKGIPLVMQFLMFVTPVVLPIPSKGWARFVYEYNPLTPLIITARQWLTSFPSDYLWHFMIINMILILMLFAVTVIYRLTMPILIERMGA